MASGLLRGEFWVVELLQKHCQKLSLLVTVLGGQASWQI